MLTAAKLQSLWQLTCPVLKYSPRGLRAVFALRGAKCVQPKVYTSCRFIHGSNKETQKLVEVEPPYLDQEIENLIPHYGELNIVMEGFDWVVLESFAAYALKKCTEFGHEAELIPVPLRKLKTTTLKDEDSKQDPSIILNKYNRTMQLQNVPAYEVPFICQVLAQHIPEGVEFTVREPDPADDAYFYIPDTELEQLKAEVAAEHEEKKARKLAKIAEKQNE